MPLKKFMRMIAISQRVSQINSFKVVLSSEPKRVELVHWLGVEENTRMDALIMRPSSLDKPGSTLKPIAAYTPALEQGYQISDLLVDEPININGYSPKNFDKQFRGQVTMYDAVVHSYNIPPVWLLNNIGIENGVRTVERFGIPLEEDDHNLGLALGGLHKGTSPLRMAQAFSTFANDGVMMEAHAILEMKKIRKAKSLENGMNSP